MKIYKKFFANRYDSFTCDLEQDLSIHRENLIQELEGKILDVGCGTGANFKYFNDRAEVIAIEPSEFMLKKAKDKFPNKDNIKIYNLGANDKELVNIIKPNSLDYVVCTLVLCTISNPKEALNRFSKLLKPHGKLILLEHIHSDKNINRFLQTLINPICKRIGDGCHLNRNTDLLIKESKFQLEEEKYFKRTLRFYSAVYINTGVGK